MRYPSAPSQCKSSLCLCLFLVSDVNVLINLSLDVLTPAPMTFDLFKWRLMMMMSALLFIHTLVLTQSDVII